jgi:hypothetical protein
VAVRLSDQFGWWQMQLKGPTMDYRTRRSETLDLWRKAIAECEGIVTARTVQEFAALVADAERSNHHVDLRALVAKWRGHWSTQMLGSSDREAAATGAAIEECADELEQWINGLKPNFNSPANPVA